MDPNAFFLPSEIARLFVGYFKDHGLVNTLAAFLKESPHLTDYWQLLKNGCVPPRHVMGYSLDQILKEYAVLKAQAARSNTLSGLQPRTPVQLTHTPNTSGVSGSVSVAGQSKQGQRKQRTRTSSGKRKKKQGDNVPGPTCATPVAVPTSSPSCVYSEGTPVVSVCTQGGAQDKAQNNAISLRPATEKFACPGSSKWGTSTYNPEFDLLENVLRQSDIPSKLADSINKALHVVRETEQGTSGNQAAAQNGKEGEAEINIDSIVEMTESDPAFQNFLRVFQHDGAIPVSGFSVTELPPLDNTAHIPDDIQGSLQEVTGSSYQANVPAASDQPAATALEGQGSSLYSANHEQPSTGEQLNAGSQPLLHTGDQEGSHHAVTQTTVTPLHPRAMVTSLQPPSTISSLDPHTMVTPLHPHTMVTSLQPPTTDTLPQPLQPPTVEGHHLTTSPVGQPCEGSTYPDLSRSRDFHGLQDSGENSYSVQGVVSNQHEPVPLPSGTQAQGCSDIITEDANHQVINNESGGFQLVPSSQGENGSHDSVTHPVESENSVQSLLKTAKDASEEPETVENPASVNISHENPTSKNRHISGDHSAKTESFNKPKSARKLPSPKRYGSGHSRFGMDDNSLSVFSLIEKKVADMTGETFVHRSQRASQHSVGGEGLVEGASTVPVSKVHSEVRPVPETDREENSFSGVFASSLETSDSVAVNPKCSTTFKTVCYTDADEKSVRSSGAPSQSHQDVRSPVDKTSEDASDRIPSPDHMDEVPSSPDFVDEPNRDSDSLSSSSHNDNDVRKQQEGAISSQERRSNLDNRELSGKESAKSSSSVDRVGQSCEPRRLPLFPSSFERGSGKGKMSNFGKSLENLKSDSKLNCTSKTVKCVENSGHYGCSVTLSSPPGARDGTSPKQITTAQLMSTSLPADWAKPLDDDVFKSPRSAFRALIDQSEKPDSFLWTSASTVRLDTGRAKSVFSVNRGHTPFIPEHCKKVPSRRIAPIEVSYSTPSPLQELPASPMNFVIDGPPSEPPSPLERVGEVVEPGSSKTSKSFQRHVSESSSALEKLGIRMPLSPSRRKPRRLVPTQLRTVKGFGSSFLRKMSTDFHFDDAKTVSSSSDMTTASQSEEEAFRQLKSFLSTSYSKPQPQQEITSTSPSRKPSKCRCSSIDTCKHRKGKLQRALLATVLEGRDKTPASREVTERITPTTDIPVHFVSEKVLTDRVSYGLAEKPPSNNTSQADGEKESEHNDCPRITSADGIRTPQQEDPSLNCPETSSAEKILTDNLSCCVTERPPSNASQAGEEKESERNEGAGRTSTDEVRQQQQEDPKVNCLETSSAVEGSAVLNYLRKESLMSLSQSDSSRNSSFAAVGVIEFCSDAAAKRDSSLREENGTKAGQVSELHAENLPNFTEAPESVYASENYVTPLPSVTCVAASCSSVAPPTTTYSTASASEAQISASGPFTSLLNQPVTPANVSSLMTNEQSLSGFISGALRVAHNIPPEQFPIQTSSFPEQGLAVDSSRYTDGGANHDYSYPLPLTVSSQTLQESQGEEVHLEDISHRSPVLSLPAGQDNVNASGDFHIETSKDNGGPSYEKNSWGHEMSVGMLEQSGQFSPHPRTSGVCSVTSAPQAAKSVRSSRRSKKSLTNTSESQARKSCFIVPKLVEKSTTETELEKIQLQQLSNANNFPKILPKPLPGVVCNTVLKDIHVVTGDNQQLVIVLPPDYQELLQDVVPGTNTASPVSEHTSSPGVAHLSSAQEVQVQYQQENPHGLSLCVNPTSVTSSMLSPAIPVNSSDVSRFVETPADEVGTPLVTTNSNHKSKVLTQSSTEKPSCAKMNVPWPDLEEDFVPPVSSVGSDNLTEEEMLSARETTKRSRKKSNTKQKSAEKIRSVSKDPGEKPASKSLSASPGKGQGPLNKSDSTVQKAKKVLSIGKKAEMAKISPKNNPKVTSASDVSKQDKQASKGEKTLDQGNISGGLSPMDLSVKKPGDSENKMSGRKKGSGSKGKTGLSKHQGKDEKKNENISKDKRNEKDSKETNVSTEKLVSKKKSKSAITPSKQKLQSSKKYSKSVIKFQFESPGKRDQNQSAEQRSSKKRKMGDRESEDPSPMKQPCNSKRQKVESDSCDSPNAPGPSSVNFSNILKKGSSSKKGAALQQIQEKLNSSESDLKGKRSLLKTFEKVAADCALSSAEVEEDCLDSHNKDEYSGEATKVSQKSKLKDRTKKLSNGSSGKRNKVGEPPPPSLSPSSVVMDDDEAESAPRKCVPPRRITSQYVTVKEDNCGGDVIQIGPALQESFFYCTAMRRKSVSLTSLAGDHRAQGSSLENETTFHTPSPPLQTNAESNVQKNLQGSQRRPGKFTRLSLSSSNKTKRPEADTGKAVQKNAGETPHIPGNTKLLVSMNRNERFECSESTFVKSIPKSDLQSIIASVGFQLSQAQDRHTEEPAGSSVSGGMVNEKREGRKRRKQLAPQPFKGHNRIDPTERGGKIKLRLPIRQGDEPTSEPKKAAHVPVCGPDSNTKNVPEDARNTGNGVDGVTQGQGQGQLRDKSSNVQEQMVDAVSDTSPQVVTNVPDVETAAAVAALRFSMGDESVQEPLRSENQTETHYREDQQQQREGIKLTPGGHRSNSPDIVPSSQVISNIQTSVRNYPMSTSSPTKNLPPKKRLSTEALYPASLHDAYLRSPTKSDQFDFRNVRFSQSSSGAGNNANQSDELRPPFEQISGSHSQLSNRANSFGLKLSSQLEDTALDLSKRSTEASFSELRKLTTVTRTDTHAIPEIQLEPSFVNNERTASTADGVSANTGGNEPQGFTPLVPSSSSLCQATTGQSRQDGFVTKESSDHPQSRKPSQTDDVIPDSLPSPGDRNNPNRRHSSVGGSSPRTKWQSVTSDSSYRSEENGSDQAITSARQESTSAEGTGVQASPAWSNKSSPGSSLPISQSKIAKLVRKLHRTKKDNPSD
ncbi:uncharacterized protein LOC101860864 [Aplysia californica]|uniref:Uncharacterized protein LOC101860864 n=1 Tax=Aplysia californica TaxID=6500 RepID=A0ABM1A1W0_APLCA|nr:uncharacterized protein LOC101860864 [Aplysia californica]